MHQAPCLQSADSAACFVAVAKYSPLAACLPWQEPASHKRHVPLGQQTGTREAQPARPSRMLHDKSLPTDCLVLFPVWNASVVPQEGLLWGGVKRGTTVPLYSIAERGTPKISGCFCTFSALFHEQIRATVPGLPKAGHLQHPCHCSPPSQLCA